MTPAVWQSAEVPPNERSYKLELKPAGWKARMWRSTGDFVQPMLRFDVPLKLVDIADRTLHELFAPFQSVLRETDLYLERGAAAPLPVPWSIGRFSLDAKKPVCFLHRVLDDPWGNVLATLFRPDSVADVTLSLVPYSIERDYVVFGIRDYDIGAGADFRRG
ncbi:MAG: hypothetical protein ABI399_03935 [Bauldia sp.]